MATVMLSVVLLMLVIELDAIRQHLKANLPDMRHDAKRAADVIDELYIMRTSFFVRDGVLDLEKKVERLIQLMGGK